MTGMMMHTILHHDDVLDMVLEIGLGNSVIISPK